MATKQLSKQPGTDLEKAALVMASEIVVARIGQLSKGDREALSESVQELNNAKTQEELGSIYSTIREILSPAPSGLARLELPDRPPAKLQKWMDFISAKIRKLRQERGWTQEQLAEQSGLPQSHVSRLEAAQHSPSFMTVDKLAKAFGVPVHDLDPSR